MVVNSGAGEWSRAICQQKEHDPTEVKIKWRESRKMQNLGVSQICGHASVETLSFVLPRQTRNSAVDVVNQGEDDEEKETDR